MPATNNELLEKEYFHLQTVIEQFDSKSLTIKAWSVTIAGAIAGSSAFAENKIILLFAAIVSLMFWLIDCSWKTFQYANYRRVAHIEEFMRGEKDNLENLQIARSWSTSFHEGGTKRFFRILFWQHVILPHGIMFALLSAIFVYSVWFQ